MVTVDLFVTILRAPERAVRRLMKKQNSSLKQKGDKIQYALVPVHAKEAMAQAFMDGARKYAPGNWKLLGIEDLLEAVERHHAALRKGEVFASDSGLQHAAHMMAGSAMIYELLRIEMGGEDLGPRPTQAEAETYRREHSPVPEQEVTP